MSCPRRSLITRGLPERPRVHAPVRRARRAPGGHPAPPAGRSCAGDVEIGAARENVPRIGAAAPAWNRQSEELGGLALDRDAAEHGGPALSRRDERMSCEELDLRLAARCRRRAPAQRGSKQTREHRRRGGAAGGQGRWSRREPVALWTVRRGAHGSTVVPAPPALIAKLPRRAPPAPPAGRHRITPLHRSVVRPGRAM